MRINEIASATEQMELWKLISTNVWQAIDTQQKQEAQRQQAKKALTKTRRVRGGVARKTTVAPMVPVKVPRNAVKPNAHPHSLVATHKHPQQKIKHPMSTQASPTP